ncbi:MAG: YifB family Mg chelatase-like AAA ATPase [Oscillospiraceae bacterium]|jgi:magnesium chelatase family protein|nr:YifB family Mg chelatase-like AAA ATPase [Oscillospiraceae bacterium]
MAYSRVGAVGLFGLNAYAARVEVTLLEGVPEFDITGLPDTGVQESRKRIAAALKNSGIPLKSVRRIVNISPASVRKTGSGFDLAICAALLSAQGTVEILPDDAFVGELALSGELNPIQGILPMALALKESGSKRVFLPSDNAKEASVLDGIEIIPVSDLNALIRHLTGLQPIPPTPRYIPTAEEYAYAVDFADVKGQKHAIRAIEVAAAGFHNILMVGIPGVGKSMIAKRIPTILPPMTFDESIQTTRIYSVAGLINPDKPLIIERPFRACSHTASAAGIVGGGAVPSPGELSLAHNGVLFLDEFPEFRRDVLEGLRQPLEDGTIHITRSAAKTEYPCRIMLVAAMNPCPCGNYGNKHTACTCTDIARIKYREKISGPIMDRIDIHVELSGISYDDIKSGKSYDTSERIKARIMKSREVQSDRYRGMPFNVNSEIPSNLTKQYCTMTADAETIVKAAFDTLGLSPRGHDRLLKVARTIADLNGAEHIEKIHAMLAVQLRAMDRKQK